MKNEIKIYVADLAACDIGILHGVWIDATLEQDDMQEQIGKMLASSPVRGAEEYAIHDHEGFGACDIGEHAGLEAVHELASFIERFPDFGSVLFNYFGNLKDAKKTAEDNYCGVYTSLADYAQELTEETTEIPDSLKYYIDYESMAKDMQFNGDIFTIETGYQEVHIFWNH